jgi:RimJ/RimL family protein N-acetyltransferase
MTNVFETARLLAREYEVSDADAAFEIYRDPVVMEFIGPNNVTAASRSRQRIGERWPDTVVFGHP